MTSIKGINIFQPSHQGICGEDFVEKNQSHLWILAFDASCGQCRGLAAEIKKFAGNRLDVAPINRPDVIAWRRRALGENAPHRPTLIRVGSVDVRAWTGAGMAVRLAARMGISGTYRLLSVLGESRGASTDHDGSGTESTAGRRQFLRFAGIGVAVSVIAGRTSLAQAAVAPSPADRWVQENRANLPRTYNAFSAYSLEYRRAIFAELSPEECSTLWTAHVKEYRDAHPGMTPEQNKVIEFAVELFGDATTFTVPVAEGTYQKVQSLGESAIASFGKDEARALVANLGPQPVRTKPASVRPDGLALDSACTCKVSDDWCGQYERCRGGAYGCGQHRGCGTGWIFICDGMCCANTTAGWLCS
ncbi:bacteriocin fulvocin C-related protein [Planomonospora sp. ID82291]|uniref:bacteriocin fulvocin C-related protein n=1 Tax=Planomonospora sp. ID82291 TaxID=2738136 RepID=UPI0018C397C4|nr:bacteriocin fulvocin C-related protein [Planomonospora sp. ID82291]MBG0816090.1 bacteriocin fulvocin C-related protein [Planomonospora sp. ID82291]